MLTTMVHSQEHRLRSYELVAEAMEAAQARSGPKPRRSSSSASLR